jgi:hypothetical protein
VCDNGATRDGRDRAYLGVPLRSADAQVLGSVCVVDFQAAPWDAEDLMLLDDLAGDGVHRVALRVAARASAEDAARAVARTERLQRLADDLARPLGGREASRRILAHVAEVTPVARAAVFAREAGGALAPLDARGDPAPLLEIAGRARPTARRRSSPTTPTARGTPSAPPPCRWCSTTARSACWRWGGTCRTRWRRATAPSCSPSRGTARSPSSARACWTPSATRARRPRRRAAPRPTSSTCCRTSCAAR